MGSSAFHDTKLSYLFLFFSLFSNWMKLILANICFLFTVLIIIESVGPANKKAKTTKGIKAVPGPAQNISTGMQKPPGDFPCRENNDILYCRKFLTIGGKIVSGFCKKPRERKKFCNGEKMDVCCGKMPFTSPANQSPETVTCANDGLFLLAYCSGNADCNQEKVSKPGEEQVPQDPNKKNVCVRGMCCTWTTFTSNREPWVLKNRMDEVCLEDKEAEYGYYLGKTCSEGNINSGCLDYHDPKSKTVKKIVPNNSVTCIKKACCSVSPKSGLPEGLSKRSSGNQKNKTDSNPTPSTQIHNQSEAQSEGRQDPQDPPPPPRETGDKNCKEKDKLYIGRGCTKQRHHLFNTCGNGNICYKNGCCSDNKLRTHPESDDICGKDGNYLEQKCQAPLNCGLFKIKQQGAICSNKACCSYGGKRLKMGVQRIKDLMQRGTKMCKSPLTFTGETCDQKRNGRNDCKGHHRLIRICIKGFCCEHSNLKL